MRLIIDSLVALALVAVVVVFVAQQRSGDERASLEDQVRANLEVLHERTAFHAALWLRDLQEAGQRPMTRFPVAVQPSWFGGAMPGNVVAEADGDGADRPWLDVAPTDDFSEHPPDPVLLRPGQAGLWYNPNTGVFRARTPLEAGDALTLAQYNRMNGTALERLDRDIDPARTPLAYVPGQVPGAALAHGGGHGPAEEADAVDVLLAPATMRPAAADDDAEFDAASWDPWDESQAVSDEALRMFEAAQRSMAEDAEAPAEPEAAPESRVRPSLITR